MEDKENEERLEKDQEKDRDYLMMKVVHIGGILTFMFVSILLFVIWSS